MTIEKHIMIVCDKCGEVDYMPTGNMQHARKLFKQNGWVFSKGKTYCKQCPDQIVRIQT